LSLNRMIDSAHSQWMDEGPESDVVVSSRIRAARNLNGLPFPHLLTEENIKNIFQPIKDLIESRDFIEKAGKLEFARMDEISAVERQILVEKHLISPDLLDDYSNKAVAIKDDEIVSIMFNEEDHLRIQCILPGLQLSQAWEMVDNLDNSLESKLDYAYSQQLGYLTACPTNTGTGLRASVMMHLPALVAINRINDVLGTVSKIGLTVRGLYGEGTSASGNLFQLSNQVTMGQTEEDIVANIMSVAEQIVSNERAARAVLMKERKAPIENKIGRAYGILRYGTMISAEESVALLSDLRMGVSLGIIKDISVGLITELMVAVRSAFLIKGADKDLSVADLEVKRASLIKERLFPNKC
jgi:protein arginine kinase